MKVKKKIISEEIKKKLRIRIGDQRIRLACTYEGCGVDDGWPQVRYSSIVLFCRDSFFL